MLIACVVAYLAVTIAIGLYAARRVHGVRDFVVAGRSLPLGVNLATVFATWFGAETVLSVSATFARDGLRGVPADPFGAAFGLVLVALLFARAFYRMDLLTIGDFYRKRYGKLVEVLTSLAIGASYLGWTSAQLTALGLVLHVLTGGALSLNQSIVIGAAIILAYTLAGGMWAIAWTDVFQSVVIVVGLVFVAWLVGDLAGGPSRVITQASADGRLAFLPRGGLAEWLTFGAAFLTLALGSIPQQDVFQRVTSARDEKTAVRGSLLGGAAYFVIAFIPMFIAYAAIVIEPNYAELFASEDAREVQRILPDLILMKTPVWAQVLFFGALLSAVLSTASGALLAPTALFTENVLRPFFPRLGDRRLLHAAAHGAGAVHLRGAAVRAELAQHDVRDGAERLQGHAGGRAGAARRRHLLEARHGAGRAAVDRRRAGRVAVVRSELRRRHGAAPAGRAGCGRARHGGRLVHAAAAAAAAGPRVMAQRRAVARRRRCLDGRRRCLDTAPRHFDPGRRSVDERRFRAAGRADAHGADRRPPRRRRRRRRRRCRRCRRFGRPHRCDRRHKDRCDRRDRMRPMPPVQRAPRGRAHAAGRRRVLRHLPGRPAHWHGVREARACRG
jgi:SSS family solute:Na+ symporter